MKCNEYVVSNKAAHTDFVRNYTHFCLILITKKWLTELLFFFMADFDGKCLKTFSKLSINTKISPLKF